MARLTRKEKQAHTRSCLMKSAAKVFASRGLEQASVEEVAENAGFTKGAFYANFKSKEELFLAMLDEHFAERLREIDEAISTEQSLEGQTRRVGRDFMRAVDADPEWERLFFEFAAYAARNEDFRQELVTRYGALRERIAAMFAERKEEFGMVPGISPEATALMTFAMANGVALEKLLEPEAVPEELYGTMLFVFFTGLQTLARQRGRSPAARPG
jgi:AcrR family transcriptional regulator